MKQTKTKNYEWAIPAGFGIALLCFVAWAGYNLFFNLPTSNIQGLMPECSLTLGDPCIVKFFCSNNLTGNTLIIQRDIAPTINGILQAKESHYVNLTGSNYTATLSILEQQWGQRFVCGG